MAKNLDRKKQTAVLLKTQEERKQQVLQKVFQAIHELSRAGEPLTFPNIAKVAAVSISYLYKWPQVKEYIQSLRDQKASQLHPAQLQDKEPGPHSLKTLHEVARNRIQELEAEIRKLKRENELLKGHVTEVYEISDECKRLREQLQELTAPKHASKVVPLQPPPVEPESWTQANNIPQDILETIKGLGIKPGVRLLREIPKHTPERVRLAITAFEKYRSKTFVDSPGGCLLTMIQDEAEANLPQQPTAPEESEFDCWYESATRTGFCLDIPKNHLSATSGELQVKVKSPGAPGGYHLMPWREALALMEQMNNV